MLYVFIFLALIASIFSYTKISGTWKYIHAGSACEFYLEPLKSEPKAPEENTLGTPRPILEYCEEYMPLLYTRWKQIIDEHNTIARNIDCMVKKYERLVALNELNKRKVNSSRPASFEKWLSKQRTELQKLTHAHEQIKQAVEHYYTEAQIRSVDSDKELKAMVESLIESTKIVLDSQDYSEHGAVNTSPHENQPKESETIPPTEPQAHQSTQAPETKAAQQEPAVTPASDTSQKKSVEQPEKPQGDVPFPPSSPPVSKPTADKSSGSSSANQQTTNTTSQQQKEVEAFSSLIADYNAIIKQLLGELDKICGVKANKNVANAISSAADELVKLQDKCLKFRFQHTKEVTRDTFPPIFWQHVASIKENQIYLSRQYNDGIVVCNGRGLSKKAIKDIESLTKKPLISTSPDPFYIQLKKETPPDLLRQKEIGTYVKLINEYAKLMQNTTDVYEAIHSSESARQREGELFTLSEKVIKLQKEIKKYQFSHVKDFASEVQPLISSRKTDIDSYKQRIKNREDIMRQAGWLNRYTMKSLSTISQ